MPDYFKLVSCEILSDFCPLSVFKYFNIFITIHCRWLPKFLFRNMTSMVILLLNNIYSPQIQNAKYTNHKNNKTMRLFITTVYISSQLLVFTINFCRTKNWYNLSKQRKFITRLFYCKLNTGININFVISLYNLTLPSKQNLNEIYRLC